MVPPGRPCRPRRPAPPAPPGPPGPPGLNGSEAFLPGRPSRPGCPSSPVSPAMPGADAVRPRNSSAGDGEARRRLEAAHRDRAARAIEPVGRTTRLRPGRSNAPSTRHLPRGDEHIPGRESFQTQPGLESVVEHDRVAKVRASVCHEVSPIPLCLNAFDGSGRGFDRLPGRAPVRRWTKEVRGLTSKRARSPPQIRRGATDSRSVQIMATLVPHLSASTSAGELATFGQRQFEVTIRRELAQPRTTGLPTGPVAERLRPPTGPWRRCDCEDRFRSLMVLGCGW